MYSQHLLNTHMFCPGQCDCDGAYLVQVVALLNSPNRFICRGSHGIVLGALICFPLR